MDEMFDEERTCSHCHVTTYCDNCPVCGRRLMRTNPSILKMRMRNRVAGEEFADKQKLDDNGFRETSKVVKYKRQTDRSENVFDNAKHQDPSISFSQRETASRYQTNSAYPEPNQGIYDQNEPVEKRDFKILFIIIIAAVVIAAILGIYKIIQDDEKYSDNFKVSYLDDQIATPPLEEYRISIDGEDVFLDFEVLDSNSNNYYDVKISNNNDIFYSGGIAFYNTNQTKVYGEIEHISLLPQQSKIVSVHLEGDIEIYELDEDGYYTIDYQKPPVSYTIESDEYEENFLQINTSAYNSESDLENLWKYLYVGVGSSYKIDMESMDGIDNEGNEYSIYFDYEQEPAVYVFVFDQDYEMIDSFSYDSLDI